MIYTPGLLTGRLSGSAGSTVASTNPFASTIHAKRMPAAATTHLRSKTRSRFSAIAKGFAQLSPASAEGWSALGQLVNRPGRLARRYHLSGTAAFQMINHNRATLGLAQLTTAPPYSLPPQIEGASLAAQHSP